MKTTLRYLLMVVAMVSFLSVSAQGLAQQPNTQMQSTSVMAGTGSTLPQAAIDGVVTTNGQQAPVGRQGHIRTGLGGGGGSGGPEDRPEPYEDPLGDVLWPLMMAIAVYALLRVYKRKRSV